MPPDMINQSGKRALTQGMECLLTKLLHLPVAWLTVTCRPVRGLPWYGLAYLSPFLVPEL